MIEIDCTDLSCFLARAAAEITCREKLTLSLSPFDVDAGASLESGWSNVANMWGWSWWVFVGAVAWAILGWVVMCITFCCSGRSESAKY